MKSCITISLVEQARGGPFVFWDGIDDGCKQAAELGFDAVEIFAPSVDAVPAEDLRKTLETYGLELAALGTGAGMVIHGLSLSSPDSEERAKAIDFVKPIIDRAGEFNASAIIGSMQGRWGNGTTQDEGRALLTDSLNTLAQHAATYSQALIYEPLNRYETNHCNTVADGIDLIADSKNITLLCDLFHMNIEEANIADALRAGGDDVGHIHFVDSNRRAAGMGHMDYTPIIKALTDIHYSGYLCAEAFPLPSSREAAKQTIDTFNKLTN